MAVTPICTKCDSCRRSFSRFGRCTKWHLVIRLHSLFVQNLHNVYLNVYLCCLTACKITGIKPTACQALQVRSQGSMMRGPECKADGKFEEVQCKSLTKECWCVDASGSERTGSRTTKYLRCPQAGRSACWIRTKRMLWQNVSYFEMWANIFHRLEV